MAAGHGFSAHHTRTAFIILDCRSMPIKTDCIPDSRLLQGLERIALSSQEYREQADRCIGWARAAVSDSERKLYRQLAVTWLENAIRLEPGAIELRRRGDSPGDQSR